MEIKKEGSIWLSSQVFQGVVTGTIFGLKLNFESEASSTQRLMRAVTIEKIIYDAGRSYKGTAEGTLQLGNGEVDGILLTFNSSDLRGGQELKYKLMGTSSHLPSDLEIGKD